MLLLVVYHTEARRVRVRQRPAQSDQDNEQLVQESESSEEERRPILQYYRADPRQDNDQRIVLIPADDDYQELYKPTTLRSRADHQVRPQQINYKSTTVQPQARRKDDAGSRPPPVQTIRNYNKVNDDGSFTFGYEAADGSFKEETRGTDCVVRGKYGYIDPDGNKREFTYVSGNPCDPNNPDGSDEDAAASDEEDENVPQNYPRRPSARPASLPVRPLAQTTARPPTTVFQNVYSHQGLGGNDESEEEENIPQTVQIGQRPIQRPRPQPQQQQQHHHQQNIQAQRQRVQILNTTPSPTTIYHQPTQPVSITPRPPFRLQTNLPATTYKPPIQILTQKAAPVSVTTPSSYSSSTRGGSFGSSTKGNIDFDSEFKKFQKDNSLVPSSTPSIVSTPKQFKSPQNIKPATNSPIYQSQLVYDPSTGQYDSALYQQLPQTDGDFQLNQRIQPYVHQQYATPQSHLVNLQSLQDQSPLYRHQIQHSPHSQLQQQHQQHPSQVQIPQQLYQRQQSELQFINSQQLFAQQLQAQQSQLQRDRVEAKKTTPHRFQVGGQLSRLQEAPAGQQYYYIQPSNANGQIESFLRGHNIEFN